MQHKAHHHLNSGASKCLLHASVFLLGLFTGSNANSQRPTIEVMVIEVPHGTLRGLKVLILTESITLGLTSLTIIHKPSIIQHNHNTVQCMLNHIHTVYQ